MVYIKPGWLVGGLYCNGLALEVSVVMRTAWCFVTLVTIGKSYTQELHKDVGRAVIC